MTTATVSTMPGWTTVRGTRAAAVVTHPVPGQHAVVNGTVDAGCVAEVRAQLREAVDNGVGELVVDVADLELGDATGLGALLGAHRRATRCGRQLVLENVPAGLHRILTFTRLVRVLTIRSRAEASA